MNIVYYHAEPVANSLKSMIPLKEKGLPYQSIYVDLHRFEQHAPWFLALNPEGQVPVLVHDGNIITHTSVINEYLDDVFPDVPLRPENPVARARMRYWNKFIDEHVMNYVSMHGWHRMIGIVARSIDSGAFAELLDRIPLHEQREKWKTARSGFSETDLSNATRKIEVAVDKAERQLADTPWLAGDSYSLADINFFSHCGVMVERMFPELDVPARAPKLIAWRQRMHDRPAIAAALKGEDRTDPRLRTFTGEAR